MKKLLVTLASVLISSVCFGNGDPVKWSSALTLSRTPQAVHIPEIMLTNEHLEIIGNGPDAHFRVTYILTNTSNKAFSDIAYGFPVDWYGSDHLQWGDNDYYSESERLYGWNEDYVKDVQFSIDNNNLQWKCSADTILTHAIKFEDILTKKEKSLSKEKQEEIIENRWLEKFGNDDDATKTETPLHDLRRRWYYTSFDFAPHQQRTLTIEYTIACNFTTSLYGNYPFEGYEGSGWSELTYDFAPSSYWGNGKAQKINIELTLPNADTEEEWREIEGKWITKFKKTGDEHHWTYKETNFNLAKAEPLDFRFWFDEEVEVHEDIDFIKQHRIPESDYSVIAKGADISLLSDNKLNTACQVFPDSANRCRIKVKLKEKLPVSGIIIYCGDASSEENYAKNQHSDSIFVSLNGYMIYGEYYPERPIACNQKKAKTLSMQDLTDAAEKIPFHILTTGNPDNNTRFIYKYDDYFIDEFTIDLYTNNGKAPYITEIVLLKVLPEELKDVPEELKETEDESEE